MFSPPQAARAVQQAGTARTKRAVAQRQTGMYKPPTATKNHKPTQTSAQTAFGTNQRNVQNRGTAMLNPNAQNAKNPNGRMGVGWRRTRASSAMVVGLLNKRRRS
jgi:hypothetical protein